MPALWMITLTVLASPTMARAANVASNCESQARNLYKKDTTVVELSLSTGHLNEVEVERAREGLQRRLNIEEQECNAQMILNSRSGRLARNRKSVAL